MGRGNFRPTGIMTDQWYISDELYRMEAEDDDYWYDYDLMDDDVDFLMDAIAKQFPSFVKSGRSLDSYWCQRVWLENKWFQIGTADNQWSLAVWISEKPDFDESLIALAGKHFERYRSNIRKMMVELFGEIHLRNGAWMSSKWTKENEMEGVKNDL